MTQYKPPVLTTVHRKSKCTTFDVETNLSKDLIVEKIEKFVDREAILYTDEYSIYSRINEHDKIKNHLTVNHSQKEYARGKIHVNTCENRHSLLRPFLRMFRGISKKFLKGYVMICQYFINYKEDAPDKILQTILKS
ncbi:MAG: transposase [Candidatus Peribacteria bacterium]|jgi:transposase-like protein|nr:transposase [Candidatus Peribacteria bacterium]